MPTAHIIGLGRSGIAAARLLQKDGWEVILSDRSDNTNLQQSQKELQQEGITVKLGYSLTLNGSLPQLIVVSPGVPWDIPILVEARKKGIDVIGELELAWRYLKSSPWVGITGTNGKTTTTALIAAIFQAAGVKAPACGNIGHPACELALLADTQPIDWIVAEISSYQIESSLEIAPKIGIWTTFTPDHLSRHKTLENYYQIKASLLSRSKHQIFNGDDPYLNNVGRKGEWKNAHWTSIKGQDQLINDSLMDGKIERNKIVYIQDAWVVAFGELILPINLFKMVGLHNQQNLLMSVAAARLAGIEKGAIVDAIVSFNGVPHRLEYIRTLGEVDYINDSKATNYDAAEVGLASVKAPVILIAGGEAKEGDDTAWIKIIQARAAKVLLIGEAAANFAQRLHDSGYRDYEIVETMEKAITRSPEVAREKEAKVVLLSPACASFDQYQSFEHRGEHFRQLCWQLA